METQIVVVAAVVAAGLAGLGAWIFGSRWLLRRRLARLRAARHADDARARCVAAFPESRPANVLAAYRWVQELVPVAALPLHPEDHLQSTLGIAPGDIEGKFEASYDCYGPETGTLVAAAEPDTVQALMAAVLAAGYEFYPSPDRDGPANG
jgi:hypothetical protein